ncbi:MAG: polyphosphate kinase 2 family protein [Actinomycetota bacterium]|nr:polyphosphate kinase 2 family protein [Actinomycetota bacterium]
MAPSDSQRWLVKPGDKVHLGKVDTRSTDGAPGHKDAEAAFPDLHEQLAGLQERLYAEATRSLLVVLQALDAGGKDGTIKHVFGGFNPASCRVVSFKVPSEEERSHDFLWRVHAKAPAKGEVVVFNRSHYEDVLVVRVHDLVPESVWRHRYELIEDFEANLVAAGTRIVKCFLHISKDEQAERFRDRLDDPAKRWKFRKGDIEERARWDDYTAAFEEAIARTSTADAPWFVVPADRKWYRNWAVSRILIEALDDMDPRYPPAEDLAGVVVE